MDNEIKELLEREIKSQIENLDTMESGSQELALATDTLSKLYKLKLDEEELEQKHLEWEQENAKLKISSNDRYIKLALDVTEIILPLTFYGIWMRRGFEFEKEGTFTSQTFRNLFSRFKPTKK